jgi:hypothetical protein
MGAVPEPASLLLTVFGALGLVARAWRWEIADCASMR